MFNPLDFLVFVRNISISNRKEAKARTVISRAYYATFLAMREWLKDEGYRFSGGKKEHYNHQEVQDNLFRRIGQRGPKDRLHTLRQLRNDADYHLNKSLTPNHAHKAITLADSIIRYINL